MARRGANFNAKQLAKQLGDEKGDMLARDPHVDAAFKSPSGQGIKAVVSIGSCADAAEHKRALSAVADCLERKFVGKPDLGGNDVPRLCNVSYDPEAFIREGDSVPFTARAKARHSTVLPVTPQHNPPSEWDVAVVRSALAFISAACNRAEWLRIACAVKNAKLAGKFHYMGDGHAAGDTLRLVVEADGQWVGLMLWGSAAYCLKDRDAFVGWDPAQRAQRQKLVVQNRRFVLLAERGERADEGLLAPSRRLLHGQRAPQEALGHGTAQGRGGAVACAGAPPRARAGSLRRRRRGHAAGRPVPLKAQSAPSYVRSSEVPNFYRIWRRKSQMKQPRTWTGCSGVGSDSGDSSDS
jgi:hypothetical protein